MVMSEKKAILVIALILLVFAGLNYITYVNSGGFNFYKSEIKIIDNQVNEKVYYEADQDYHTLYRNFASPVSIEKYPNSDSIKINKVSCSEGKAYLVDSEDNGYLFTSKIEETGTIAFTERNEIGCTFENNLGFLKGHDYSIESSYEIYPKKIFQVKGKNYIKFIAYSSGRHKTLIKDKNFFVDEKAVTKDIFLPSETIIIYLPYKGDTSSLEIISLNNFEYDYYWTKKIIPIILLILPAFFIFILWYKLGKETSFKDLPSTLSYYPNERKPWQVAAFFHPPFIMNNSNFFGSMLLDLQRRKIIDILNKDKKVYIKIIKKSGLDEIETKFISLLETIIKKAKKEDLFQDYVSLESIRKIDAGISVRYSELSESVRDEKSKYLDSKSGIAIFFLAMLMFFSIFITGAFLQTFFWSYLIAMAIILIMYFTTALFHKFKENYYSEYQEWQAFRAYLKSFPSMKQSPPEAVKLWDKYLVYATALGVSKQVLKKFKEWKIIDEEQFKTYSYAPAYSSLFMNAGAPSSAGNGGFSGSAGGGVGGGGGGGR